MLSIYRYRRSGLGLAYSIAVDTPDTWYQDTRVSADTIADTPIRIYYNAVFCAITGASFRLLKIP